MSLSRDGKRLFFRDRAQSGFNVQTPLPHPPEKPYPDREGVPQIPFLATRAQGKSRLPPNWRLSVQGRRVLNVNRRPPPQ